MLPKKEILMIIMILIFLFGGCSEKIEPGTTAKAKSREIRAQIAVAALSQQPLLYEAVGTINARTVATLSSKIMGTVEAVHVDEGDSVKKGDLLLVIDLRQVTAELDRAEAGLKETRRAEASAIAAVASADAAVELAGATYQRYLALVEEKLVSQQEFDKVTAQQRQAQAFLAQSKAMREAARHRVERAEAGVRAATVRKSDALIRAPYDARVTAKMIEVGDLASPGTPFFTLEKKGLYCADLTLPERYIQAVGLGKEVKVLIPALGNTRISGTIARIVPSADPKNGSFRIRVNLPERTNIKSGIFARIFIPIGGTGMLLIPSAAIVPQGQLEGVFIVNDDHTARFRLIRTGKVYGDSVEILSGLKSGDKYVLVPPPNLEDGVRVEAAT